MLTVYKLCPDHTVDFAAEELKKYLRMLMPEKGDIAISYDPKATEGFRLGLLRILTCLLQERTESLMTNTTSKRMQRAVILPVPIPGACCSVCTVT